MRKLSLALVAGALFSLGTLLWTAPSHAQGACFKYEKVLERLVVKYGEAPIARGVDANGNLALVLANADRSTWTILVVYATNNVACIIGAGSDWAPIEFNIPEAEPDLQSF